MSSTTYVWDFNYDAGSRITNIADPNSTANNSYGYDVLDRITSSNLLSTTLTRAYAYDATYNRTSTTINGTSTNNLLSRILELGAESLTYSTMGNTLTNNTNTYTYDNKNRLATISKTGTTQTNYLNFSRLIRNSSIVKFLQNWTMLTHLERICHQLTILMELTLTYVI